MKTKFGAIIVAGSGKIGGHVASKNRSGSYLRTKVTPVNRNSNAQIAVRGRLSSIAKAWRSLSAAAVKAWNSAVSDYSGTDIFGDVKNPTGFCLYQKLNNNSLRCGGAAITLPPLPIGVGYATALSATATHAGVMSIVFAPTPVAADNALEIRATKAMSAGVSFVKSEYRIIGKVAAAGTSPYDAAAAYIAVFGSIGAAGEKIFFEVQECVLTTGQMGAKIQTSCIIS